MTATDVDVADLPDEELQREEAIAQRVLTLADRIFERIQSLDRNKHCPRETLRYRSLVMALRAPEPCDHPSTESHWTGIRRCAVCKADVPEESHPLAQAMTNRIDREWVRRVEEHRRQAARAAIAANTCPRCGAGSGEDCRTTAGPLTMGDDGPEWHVERRPR